MSFQPPLASSFNKTVNRSSRLSPQSGMCSFCTEDCAGTCELGLAAVLGAQTVYPTTTGANQIASEKDYPVDWSHFNINGRVFGAQGLSNPANTPAIFNVGLERVFGRFNPVKIAMPVLLPALIKLNWKDYFSGAAMAGVCCVVGEDAKSNDPGLLLEEGKIKAFPLLDTILDSFRRYDRGYGQIVVQCNVEDDLSALPEYAMSRGATALEFKFGQSAKGTQPVRRIKNLADALKKQADGALVHPDPSDPQVRQAYEDGVCPNFYSYGRLPLWDEDNLPRRIERLRELGVRNIYFKTAAFDNSDLERLLRLASTVGADMVTFDGAGGGSGYSPCKMMNEWSLPTVCMEEAVLQAARKLGAEGAYLPALTVTGGFASEDQVFKALSFGDGLVASVGIGRAAMAAAMSAKKTGEAVKSGNVPAAFKKFGGTIEEVFCDLPDLRALYGREANDFPPGAVGVFSYLNKIAFGLRHFAALNRKFNVALLSREDLIPLTRDARALLAGEWFEYRH